MKIKMKDYWKERLKKKKCIYKQGNNCVNGSRNSYNNKKGLIKCEFINKEEECPHYKAFPILPEVPFTIKKEVKI